MSCYYFSPILLLIVSLSWQPWVANTQIEDCFDEACGDLMLRPPFAWVNNCSSNDYFRVTCDTASRPQSYYNAKAILSKLKLEIIDMDVNFRQGGKIGGSITVKLPVASRTSCISVDHDHLDNHNTNNEDEAALVESKYVGLNLSGSPFFIDTTRNVFASVGCDGSGLLYNETTRIGGCTSRCNPQQQVINGCNGNYCCYSDLRSTPPFQTYSYALTSCRAAFLISRKFLHTNPFVDATMVEAAVPVLLLWTHKYNDTAGSNTSDENGTLGLILDYFLIYGIATIILACYCVGLGCAFESRRRNKEAKLRAKYFTTILREEWPSHYMDMVEKMELFSEKVLKEATDNFSEARKIGKGGQGVVYKGMLANKQVIAVKMLVSFDESKKCEEIINEVILLSNANHRNIVKLLGYCLETKAPMLVYEYISNGTLSQNLRGSKEIPLAWEIRKRIASEAAGAISYLHYSLSPSVVHRDLKSANILLDENFQAKVADFGISKVVRFDQTRIVTNAAQGTYGYLDPEYYGNNGHFTLKSDVYSFGVILVELLTGKPPILETLEGGKVLLAEYFTSSRYASKLDKILDDPNVSRESNMEEVMFVADLAKRCLKPTGEERPTMKEVAKELEGLLLKQQASFEIENVVS